MMIFFRETIVELSTKQNNQKIDYSDYSQLYTDKKLNPIDLFNLYYNKSLSTDRSVALFPQDSTFFQSYINELSILNSNKFCDYIKNEEYTINITNRFNNSYIPNSITCDKKLGLKDLMEIIYIDIKTMIFSYENTNTKTNELFSSFLLNYNLTRAIDTNELFINKALLLGIENQFKVIEDLIINFSYITIIRTCLFLVFCALMFVLLFVIARFLKDLINKNKAILTIIPNEVIINTAKVQEALQFLGQFN